MSGGLPLALASLALLATSLAPSPAVLAPAQEQLATRGALAAVPAAPLFGAGGVIFQDVSGRIQHIALQFGNVEFDKPLPEKTRSALLEMYRTLFTRMSPDTRFTVVAADERAVADLERMIRESGMARPERVTLVNARTQRGISIWIRDSMLPVVAPDGSTRVLIQDRTYWPGPEDARVPELIDQAHNPLHSVAHRALRIDGGNLVNNQTISVIGEDSVEHTRARLRELAANPLLRQEIIRFYESRTGHTVVPGLPQRPGEVSQGQMWEEVPELVFRSEFQRNILVIGNDDPSTPLREEQPVFHIDMAVTPVFGEHKFLIGDPGMAIRILRSLSPEDRARVNREMAREAGLDPACDLIGKLIEVNGTPEHQANFDNVARELAGRGYQIERIPSLIGLRTTWSLPYLTYNNSIQENYKNETGEWVRKVYLPVYGCEPLDRVAIETYERLGYEVVPLRMAAISILEGAIRCTSHVLERTEVPPPLETPAGMR